MRQMTDMAKALTRRKTGPAFVNRAGEQPQRHAAAQPVVAEYTYQQFAGLAALVPFTQKDWAAILHLSERTLQRYAKYQGSFEGIYVDRILLMERLIHKGLETFADADALYRWLKRDKQVLGNTLQFASLSTTQGILDIIDELGRIQHGVYI